MSIRIVCPNCSARLSADPAAAGRSVRCPKCRTPVAVMPRGRRRENEDGERRGEDDSPGVADRSPRRRRAAHRPKARRRVPVAALVVAAAAVLVVGAAAAVGVMLARRHSEEQGGAHMGQPADPGVSPPAAGAKRYVPGVSDKALAAFLQRIRKTKGPDSDREVTEEQVLAIMGEPTRREAPVTVRRDGRVLTVQEAHWEYKGPDRQIASSITFVNNRFGGGIIGLETTPHKPAHLEPGPSQPPLPAPAPDRPVVLSRPPADLLVGVWEATVPAAPPGTPKQPEKVRLTFTRTAP